MQGLILVGSSKTNTKEICVDSNFMNASFRQEEKFDITITNGTCRVQRIDANSGWDQLIVYADVYPHTDIPGRHTAYRVTSEK